MNDKLRLHLEESGLTPEPNAAIEQAIKDCSMFNNMPHRYAVLEVLPMKNIDPIVRLFIGDVNDYGEREHELATWSYFLSPRDGKEVVISKIGHI